jgi:hypothetical protein
MGSRIPRTPARSSGDLAIGAFFDGSCGSFGWDGNCKVEPPQSLDVVLFGPLENEISQINLRILVQNSPIGEKLVNIPIRQSPYFQRFTCGNWIASLTASEDAQKTKREERC